MDPSLQWIILGFFIATCILASLKTMATSLRHETEQHNLRVEAAKVRKQLLARLQAEEEGARGAVFGQFVQRRIEPARKAA